MMRVCERAAAARTFPITDMQGSAGENLVTFHCHGNNLQVTLDRLYSAATPESAEQPPDDLCNLVWLKFELTYAAFYAVSRFRLT